MTDPIVPENPAPVVVVSAAQVWSAAAQNIIIALVIGALMLYGKVSTELGLLALGAVSGIDVLGRLKAKASTGAALAIGATGMLSRLPHLLVALAVGGLVSGCAGIPKDAGEAARAVRTALDQATYVCTLPVAESPELSKVCRQVAEARAGVCSPQAPQ